MYTYIHLKLVMCCAAVPFENNLHRSMKMHYHGQLTLAKTWVENVWFFKLLEYTFFYVLAHIMIMSKPVVFVQYNHKKPGGKFPGRPGRRPRLEGPGIWFMSGSGPNGSNRGLGSSPGPGGMPGVGLNPPGMKGKVGKRSLWPPEIKWKVWITWLMTSFQGNEEQHSGGGHRGGRCMGGGIRGGGKLDSQGGGKWEK